MAGLREQLADTDARTFAGRAAELRAVDAFLAAHSAHRFLFVHGPRGIGKSALLREVGRRGRAAGYDVRTHVPAGPGPGDGRVLVLLDDVAQVADAAASLREQLLDVLPAGARVVLAGSERPHPAWWADGLDAIARDLRLAPLSDEDARAVLTVRGVTLPRRQDEIIAWAQGSPLAIGVAASFDPGPGAVPAPLEPALEEQVGGWLAGDAIESVDPEVLEVAALTSAVDARLLSAALPGHPLRGAMTGLFGLPVVSRHGHAASLHPAMRQAILARLRAHQRSRYRELMQRVALHLAERARLGDHEALVQLSGLIESPALVAGTGPRGSRTHVADSLRDGDLRALGASGEGLDWFVDRFPEFTTVIRHPDGRIAGLVGGAPLPAIAADEGDFAVCVCAALSEEGCDPARTLVGPAVLLETDPVAANELLRVGYSSALRRGGVAGLRFLLSYYPDPARLPSAFLEAAPWRQVPIDGASAWLVDWGPDGAIGFALNTVLREQGYPDRYFDESLLASDPARLAAELPRIFGDSAEDRLLRRVIELAHLSPGMTQSQVITDLHVSRATYFRLLRRARERVLSSQGRP